MIAYVDASVIIRIIRQEKHRLREWSEIVEGVTSELSRVECYRTLLRYHTEGDLTDEQFIRALTLLESILSRMRVVPLERAVIRRACTPATPLLRTLDAIHLSTALEYRDVQPEDVPPIVFATHDKALAFAAGVMGLRAIGV